MMVMILMMKLLLSFDIIEEEGAGVGGKVLATIHLMQEGVDMFQAGLSQLKNADENTSLTALGNIIKAIQLKVPSTHPTSIPSTSTTPKPSSNPNHSPSCTPSATFPALQGSLGATISSDYQFRQGCSLMAVAVFIIPKKFIQLPG